MIAKWRVKVLGNVLRDVWPALLAIGGLGAAWLVGWVFSKKTSDHILYAGMTIELLGIFLVAWELTETLKKFGRPSLIGQIGAWFGRLKAVVSPKRFAVSTGFIRGESSVRGVGRSIFVAGVGATSDERISALEKNLESLRNEMDARVSELTRELVQAKESLAQAKHELNEATRDIDRKVEDLAVGGTHLDVVGLFWIFVGVFLTNIPDVIAGWLG